MLILNIMKFLIAVLGSVAAASQERCYALSLEGGGDKGAYQAGVIWGFMHYGNPENFQW